MRLVICGRVKVWCMTSKCVESRGLHAQARIQKEVKSQKGQELVCIRFYGHDKNRRIDCSSRETESL